MLLQKIKWLFRIMPWLLAFVLAGVFILLLHYEWQRQDVLWEETLQLNLAMQAQQVEATRWHLTGKATQAAELLADNKQIVGLIRAGYAAHLRDATQEGQEISDVRAELFHQLQPYWLDLQDTGTRYLQIHLAPDGTSFLRVHRPERFGDHLINTRPLVMEVLATGIGQNGLEIGRHGPGYRAVVPIFATDEPSAPVIGVIEVGQGLLSTRVQAQGTGKAVLLAPELVDNVLWDKARTELTAPRNRAQGLWLLETYSDPIAAEWYGAGMIPIPFSGSARNKDFVILAWNGRDYLLKVFPLKDFLGQSQPKRRVTVALLSWDDISAELATHEAIRQNTLYKWLFALLLAEVMLLIVWRFTRRYIRALVDEHRIQLEHERDVSEEVRQRLELVLASSEAGFWDWNLVDNQSVFSPEWRALCGIPPEVVILDDVAEWFDRIHPNDKGLFFSDRLRHIKGGTPIYENEHRLRTQDGSYKWIYTRGKVVARDADGRATRMLGIYTDISARKQNELTILRQQAALRSLNEIASLPSVEFDEQLRRALVLGARHLGMRTGVISHVEDDVYSVKVQVAPDGQIRDGDIFDLVETYSGITLADGDVVAIHHMSESAFADHPSFSRWQQESYLGVPFWVEGDVYGTVCFTSPSVRTTLYDSQDKDFMRLLARWIGSVIGHWQQDIRQQKLYERYTKLSEHLPGFLYQYQLKPDGSSSFLYSSAGISAIYGISPAQALLSAEAIYRVIHPDDSARVAESVARSAADLSIWQITYRVNHPQRGLIWVHGDARPERLEDGSILWHGFISDVTAAKRAEQHLHEANALREAIFDAASLAIISFNEHGIIKTFNRGAENMLGYSAEEMIGKKALALFHIEAEIQQRAKELTRELGVEVEPGFEVFVAQARSGQTHEREWHYVHRDGTEIPVLLSVSCLRNAAGQINGFFGIARDISELKRTDRLKSEFISTVSHELRTPLTAISGSLGLIIGGATGDLPPNAFKMINIAHKNSLRLNHLVNDLLDMEKLVAGKMHFDMQSHDLGSLVQQAIEANAAYAEHYQVRYELQGAEVDVQVMVDARRLVQVLTNFLSNAAKFSLPESVVFIAINLQGDIVRVSVRDTGEGVAEEFRSRIFQKFSQADASDSRQKGGTGLGLAICKELVERMGGSVGFDSIVNEGSTFYFDLPCFNASALDVADNTESGTGKKILVVEDDHDVADLLATMLRNTGYHVDIAHTGAVAMLYLGQRNYSLITLDLLLPDMNGTQIIRYVRAQAMTANVPIVVVSAAIDEGRLSISADLAATDINWLQKPLDESHLIHLVEQAIANNTSLPVRILHVEDDVDLQRLIVCAGQHNAQFDAAGSLLEARQKIAQNKYELVILDLGLPDGNGWELVPELRRLQPHVKIIVLSANELSDEQQLQIEMSLIKSHESNVALLTMIEQLLEAGDRK